MTRAVRAKRVRAPRVVHAECATPAEYRWLLRQGLDDAKNQLVNQVLGYFKNSYRNPSAGAQQWDTLKLIFDERDPVENANDHAGVHLIRRFYPDFSPDRQDFALAYWGKP